jgi:lipoprotein LpqH
VKCGLTVAVAGAAILAAGISGCSSNKSSGGGGGTSAVVSGSTSVAAGGSADTKVIIDGKDQHVSGDSVVCMKIVGNISITVGGSGSGISASVTDANPPEVKLVTLGTVDGVVLGYTPGSGQGKATATRDGNHYKISGTATGADGANPQAPVSKPFEIDVTCP